MCGGCGCVCDDVLLDCSGEDVRLQPACVLGAQWFTERVRPPADAPGATINGEPAEVEAALARAAELLRGARRPLLYGFDGSTVEDARAAVALADRLGALVMTENVAGPWPGAPALALRGATTATLGEIRDRSRVVVIWREDPMLSHPRLLARLGFDRKSRAATGRTLVVVDDRDTATARAADRHVRVRRDLDADALTGLRARNRGLPADAVDELDADVAAGLIALMRSGNAAVLHGAGLGRGAGGYRRVRTLFELVRDLSSDAHVVTMALRRDGNAQGAEDVLTWQTGFAEATSTSASGHPELAGATQPLAEDAERRRRGGAHRRRPGSDLARRRGGDRLTLCIASLLTPSPHRPRAPRTW